VTARAESQPYRAPLGGESCTGAGNLCHGSQPEAALSAEIPIYTAVDTGDAGDMVLDRCPRHALLVPGSSNEKLIPEGKHSLPSNDLGHRALSEFHPGRDTESVTAAM